MIEDAFINVKTKCDYYEESKDFLLDRNGVLSSWLEYLSVNDELIKQLARFSVEGR